MDVLFFEFCILKYSLLGQIGATDTDDAEYVHDSEDVLSDDNIIKSPPHKLQKKTASNRWRHAETLKLLNNLLEYHQTFDIELWTEADWQKACQTVTQLYGYSVDQCKSKRKRLCDYLAKIEKEGNVSWVFADIVAKLRSERSCVKKALFS